jgi:hypothetical protein
MEDISRTSPELEQITPTFAPAALQIEELRAATAFPDQNITIQRSRIVLLIR